ncbi:ester cyclase [Streptomonospora algeriensis]|uniref:Ester cyclase n=1 Tax=Streptomonospora algeriensis TaxID=995084 RepID=A0ABW3B940_9ACTN
MSTPTPTSTAAAIQQDMFDAIMEHDYERLRALMHPDYTYTGPDGVERGADESVAVAEGYTSAFPDAALETMHNWTPNPEVSVLEFRVRGTHQGEFNGMQPTGRQIEVVCCNVVEVSDGKLYREREYLDGQSLMQQLGAVPEQRSGD